jgi:uncharacterized protein DUF6677
MSTSEPQASFPDLAKNHSLLGGFLSYLVPGLGQIYQGRTGKGALFLACLWGMFFAGQAMGDWQNVYLPDVARGPDDVNPWENNPWHLPPALKPLANVYHRWHFLGQVWIGVAAWPAIWQHYHMPVPSEQTSPFLHNFQKGPRSENELNEYLANHDKTPDVAWVYTVIAGVLNILVIYDAYAGPAMGIGDPAKQKQVQAEAALT